MIYDISRMVSPRTAVWPGDRSYAVEPVLRREAGMAVNLTTISLSPHTGTHADAYYHYEDEAIHPAQMPLHPYIGRARVITVAKTDGALTPDDFAPDSLNGAERLLIHSAVSDIDDDGWAAQYPYLSMELIAALAEQGAVLIGLDSPSVDAFDSHDLPCHHGLRRYHLVNLECLILRGVPDGDYELIALPLKLDLTCGSPVRAILRTL